MKKRLTYNSVAFSNLKNRKRQYVTMILGITAAMIFTTSILLLLLSANETDREKYYRNNGTQDLISASAEYDGEFYKNAVKDKKIKDYGLAHIIGYAYTDEKESYLGTAVAWMDGSAQKISRTAVEEGRMPQSSGEIAFERIALEKLGIDARVGEKIKLLLCPQNKMKRNPPVETEYTLVGILSDKRTNLLQNYNQYDSEEKYYIPAAFVAEDAKNAPGSNELLSAYVVTDGKNVYDSYQKLYGKSTLSDGEQSTYMVQKPGFSVFRNAENSMWMLMIIAIALTLASCTAIVNSFNANLKERKQQIGMLRAVGATSLQIKRIFAREAFIISLISTPVSIAFSYGLVSLVLKLIKSETVMTKSIIILPIAAVVGVITVMIAASIPLASASRITPMQAIRNIDLNRKFKLKKIKTQKQYSLPKLLAQRNRELYKGGRAAVSVMLTVTILISSFAFSYIEYSKNEEYNPGYDYELWGIGQASADRGDKYNFPEDQKGMNETERQDAGSIAYISESWGIKRINTIMEISGYNGYYNSVLNSDVYETPFLDYENLSDELSDEEEKRIIGEFFKTFNETHLREKEYFKIKNDFIPMQMQSVDAFKLEELQEYVLDGEIDTDKLSSGEEVILIAPKKAEYKIRFDKYGYSTTTAYDDSIDRHKDYTTVDGGELPYKAGDTVKVSSISAKRAAASDTVYGESVTTTGGESVTVTGSESADTTLQSAKERFDFVTGTETKTDREVKIGAIISPSVFSRATGLGMPTYFTFGFFTTPQGLSHFDKNAKYEHLMLNVDGEIDRETDKYISSELDKYKNKYFGYLNSTYARQKNSQEFVQSVFTEMIVLIIIAYAICASIINNTLTAGIRESKKEIGTIRAFGASLSDISKSYVRLLFSMFVWGLGLGFGGYSGIYLIMYLVNLYKRKTISGFDGDMGMVFSPWMPLVFTAVLLVICSVNLWLKIRRETKNSIIENIREL